MTDTQPDGAHQRRILFNGHDLKFLTPVIEYFRAHPRYAVLLDEHSGHVIESEAQSRAARDQADVIFCEWALGNAVWYSQNKRPDQTLIVRLHLQEFDTHHLDQIHWENVDQLVVICPWIHERVLARWPALRGRTSLIYNPIPTEGLCRSKGDDAAMHLGFVGLVPQRKRLDLALEILTKLHEAGSTSHLHIKGKRPEEYPWMLRRTDEMAWYERIYRQVDESPVRDYVHFCPAGNDMTEWYSTIGMVLSTSDFEGSHQAIAEGMASGAVPVIRNWDGADMLYPSEHVFADVDEAAGRILAYQRDPQAFAAAAEQAHAFAAGHFDQEPICRTYEQLIDRLPPSSAGEAACVDVVRPHGSVVHVAYIAPGAQHGYRTRVEQEVSLLAGMGFDVTLAAFCPANVGWLRRRRHGLELARGTGARVHVLPTEHFFDLDLSVDGPQATVVKPLCDVLRETAARLVHGQATYASHLAMEAARSIGGLRVVWDNHGVAPEEERMTGSHEDRIVCLEQWEQELLSGVDCMVAVSQRMLDHYRCKYGAAPARSVLLPCSVRAAVLAKRKRSALRTKIEAWAKGPVLAYVGSCAAWQCIDEMVRLFVHLRRFLPTARLLLLIPRADHKTVRRKLADAGVPNENCFIRSVGHDEVLDCIEIADAGLLLRHETPVSSVASPTKFGEYLAAGLPVILTRGIGDFSGLAEREGIGFLLDSSYRGTFDDGQVRQLADFVRDVRADRQHLAERCRQVVSRELDWTTHIRNLVAAYKDLTQVR